MRQTKAVVLDLDGLIVDSEPLHQRAFEMVLARYGVDHRFSVEEYARFFVGVPVKDNARWLVDHFGLKADPEVVLAERERMYEELIRAPENLHAMPGLERVLDALDARNMPLAVASGSPRNQVDTILRGMGIASRFRVVVAGTDVPRAKPAPDVYLQATRELDVAPAESVAIEDSASGITAAKAAGLTAIAVPNPYTVYQDLERADARADSLEQALDLVP
ncbi:MAG: HAD family phosphatase [Chloroflexi bacterium]|nr:HAD family phosphatase [Chloroflexota bacterium]